MSERTFYYEPRFEFQGTRITHAVQRLILLNTFLFAAQLVLNIFIGEAYNPVIPPGGVIVDWLMFDPSAFLRGQVWGAVTYMFLHGGLMHLFMNMLWLFIFGPDVERTLGTRQFYRFYVVCGALGVMLNYVPFLYTGGAAPMVVGASGAVMGVLVAFAVVYPERQFFLFPFPVPINARAMVLIVIVLNLMAAVGGNSNMSVATHFGGMAVGGVYMKFGPTVRGWFRSRKKSKPKDEDPVGEAVNKVLRFEDEKRKRKK
jgi:membrane associated rhomboid family serine protease